jgi:predicted AlkP superfamily phosphohydrolase/phosphomutase
MGEIQMSSEKVFILGLDGASPDIIESLIDQGKVPTFKKLKEEGVMGRLRTTIPPITGSAWSSFMTGKNPGKHGIFDFIRRKKGTYLLSPINAEFRDGRSFWSWAGDEGKKICVFNVPITYPPEKVNGIMVSGMLTPSNKTDYTYPPSLAKELERITGGYEIHIKESYSKGGEERFLTHLYEVTDKRIKAMEYLFGLEDWDVFIAIFQGIDVLQHELWHCWDRNHFRHDPSQEKYFDVIPEFYQKMDAVLKRVLEDWIGSERTLIVMSDHGAGPLEKLLYINNFLMEKGFLKLKKGVRTSIKNLLFRSGFVPMNFYHLLLRMGLGRLKRKARFGQTQSLLKPFFLSFEDVDWSQSVAYSIGSTAGQVYLNLKGREPQGIVEPDREFGRIREEIIRELKELIDEETGEKVVGEIYRKEEIYHGPHLNEAPDIIFFAKGFEIAAFGEYEFASHRILDYSRGVSASHRMEGLLMMKGKRIKEGMTLEGAQIIDLAPSVLYLLNLPIPNSMDGRVLQKAFLDGTLQEQPIRFLEEEGPSSDFHPGGIYSDEEEEDLKRRLRTLGYLT